MSWSPNGNLLASGGNDNKVNIFDIRKSKKALFTIEEHKAAIRALEWCPWDSNLLATGGGSGDM